MILIVYFSNINKSKKKYLIINTSNNNNDVLNKSKNDSYYSLYKLNETQLPNTIYEFSSKP